MADNTEAALQTVVIDIGNSSSPSASQPINPEKLKVADLKDWLKAHNVPFHNSWKKLQLVQKIKDAIADGAQPPIPKKCTKTSLKVSCPAVGTGWGKTLDNINVTTKMVDEYVAQHNTSSFHREDLSEPSVKLKAFKFAIEGYLSNILTYQSPQTVYVTSRCFRCFAEMNVHMLLNVL